MEIIEINKHTWRWQYCSQSGWSFQIGEPHLKLRKMKNLIKDDGSKIDRSFLDGEMSIHVFYTDWEINGAPWVNASSHDSHEKKDLSIKRMEGIKLIRIQIHDDGWVQKMWFDSDVTIKIRPFDDSSFDNIANLINKTSN